MLKSYDASRVRGQVGWQGGVSECSLNADFWTFSLNESWWTCPPVSLITR